MESNSTSTDFQDTKSHLSKNLPNDYLVVEHKIESENIDTDTDYQNNNNNNNNNIDNSNNNSNDYDYDELKHESQDLISIDNLNEESNFELDLEYLKLIEKVSKEGVDKDLNLKSNEIEWKVLKEALRKEIVIKSKQMFEKYGGLEQLDYLPYNCSLHSEIENSQRESISSLQMIGEYSCKDCGKSILNHFLKDILKVFDSHLDFPPTIQRICELLIFPECYNNTKSFLYALDKVSQVKSSLIT